MATTELDTFICKFYQLWQCGHTAHLDLDTHAGTAWVGLRVQLGHDPPGPVYHHQHQHIPRASSSRERRRARRAAAADQRNRENSHLATATETVVEASEEESLQTLQEETCDADLARDVDTQEPEVFNEQEEDEEIELTEKPASQEFECPICEFKSTWENGLKIHMGRKHSRIEQIDGCVDIADDDEFDNKYENTKHYWEKGSIGIAYCNFIDANDIIVASQLSEEDILEEKVKVLEARRTVFGNSYKNYPPWSKK